MLRLKIGPTDSVGHPSESDRVQPDSNGRPTDFYESDRTSGVRPDSDRTRSDPIGRPVESVGVRRTSDTILGLILTILGLKLFSEVRVGLRRVRFESVRTPVKPKIAVLNN